MAGKLKLDSIKNIPPADAPPAVDEPADAPETTKGGKLKQAWTDDATGKTYLPGETLEGDDVD